MKNKKITKQPSKNLSFRLAQPLLAPPLSKGRMGGVKKDCRQVGYSTRNQAAMTATNSKRNSFD